MNLKNHPPMFVPPQFRREVEKLSKAALMDIAWDYAMRTVGEDGGPDKTMAELRETRDIIVGYRKGRGL